MQNDANSKAKLTVKDENLTNFLAVSSLSLSLSLSLYLTFYKQDAISTRKVTTAFASVFHPVTAWTCAGVTRAYRPRVSIEVS